MLGIIFQMTIGLQQVEHGVEPLKVGLNEWQFDIKF